MKNKTALLLFCGSILFLIHSCDLQSPSTKTTSSSTVQEPDISTDSSDLQPKDYPLAFRRTTLIVRDIEKALALYRDAIGMEIIYDNIIRRPHPTEDRERVIRLIFLKAIHNFYGVLGLVDYEYDETHKVDKPIRKEGFTPQNVVLLFNTNDLESRFKKIKEVPGIEILSEPKLTEYPSYDGTEIIRVMVSKFYDADGFLVEFNQLLDDL